MPDEPSAIELKLKECLAIVNAEDRVQVRDLQDAVEAARREAQRFGDLVSEIGRQIRALARRAATGDADQLADLTALASRLIRLGMDYAEAHDLDMTLPEDWASRENREDRRHA